MSTRAKIKINSVAGSRIDISPGAVVNLSNDGLGDESTYLWELIDVPEGSTAVLSSSSIAAPHFTADIEGSYLIKLTVNRTLDDEDIDQAIAGVLQYRSATRIPAAGESTEVSLARGWARDVNRALQKFDRLTSDPTAVIGLASELLSRGRVVAIDGAGTIMTSTPGEATVPNFTPALATDADLMQEPLYLVDHTPTGGLSASSADPVFARMYGVVGPITLGGGGVGGKLYVTDTGSLSTSPGTNVRRVGTIAYVDGSDYWIHFNGSLGHHEGNLLFEGDQLVYDTGDLTVRATGDVRLEANSHYKLYLTDRVKLHGVAGAEVKLTGVADPVDPPDAVNKRSLDTSGSCLLYFGNTSTPDNTTVAYLEPGFGHGTAPSTSIKLPLGYDTELSRLSVYAEAGPVSASLSIKVCINSVETGIEAKLSAGSHSTQDLTNIYDTAAQGDILTIKVYGDPGISTGATGIVATLCARRLG